MNIEIIYTSELGELISPFLLLIRSTGFFEAYFLMHDMTALSILLYW